MGFFGQRRRRFLDRPHFDSDDPSMTVIAPGTRFEGDIRGPGAAVVGGRLDGDLLVEGAVIVEASGSVGGNVEAAAARIEGAVDGSLVASGRVEVGAAGRVVGSLRATRLDLAAGARISGPVEVEDGPHDFSERRAGRS